MLFGGILPKLNKFLTFLIKTFVCLVRAIIFIIVGLAAAFPCIAALSTAAVAIILRISIIDRWKTAPSITFQTRVFDEIIKVTLKANSVMGSSLVAKTRVSMAVPEVEIAFKIVVSIITITITSRREGEGSRRI